MPKLFIRAAPGASLARQEALNFVRSFKRQKESDRLRSAFRPRGFARCDWTCALRMVDVHLGIASHMAVSRAPSVNLVRADARGSAFACVGAAPTALYELVVVWGALALVLTAIKSVWRSWPRP